MDLEAIKKQAQQKASESTGDFAPWLEFEEGDEFLGTISEVRGNPWEEGKLMYEVVDLETGEAFSLRTHRALVSQITAQKAEVGDFIYVKYLGMTKAQDSSFKYNNYEVGVVKPEDVVEG